MNYDKRDAFYIKFSHRRGRMRGTLMNVRMYIYDFSETYQLDTLRYGFLDKREYRPKFNVSDFVG